MIKIASVVLGSATRQFDLEYSYIIPENLEDKVIVGRRVVVPFGKSNRSEEGYVLRVEEVLQHSGDIIQHSESCINSENCIINSENHINYEGLKSIIDVMDEGTILDEKAIKLCRWMKERYICTYGDAIKSMLPPGMGMKSLKKVRLLKDCTYEDEAYAKILEFLKCNNNECEIDELKKQLNIKNFTKYINKLQNDNVIEIFEEYSSGVREKTVRAVCLIKTSEEIIDAIEGNQLKNIKQIRILKMLLENDNIPVSDIKRFLGVSVSVLETLRRYGYIDYCDIEAIRDPLKGKEVRQTYALEPTEEQRQVLEDLKRKIDSNTFNEALIHGVTGCGKTEVYMQLIQYISAKGKQAIVLVPEISLTPQMVERFKGRFGNEVAVMHSRLSIGERYDQWRLIKEGKIKVAVGARSAVFAPFNDIGLIIIDEEHETSYKSEITPKYNAADIARQRCIYANALLLYGSATPSVESYYRALNSEISLLKMSQRPNNIKMPAVELVDMRQELDNGNRSVFSAKLASEIEKNISSGQQTILFLNRRGYSSFVLCRSCGYVIKCRNCNISMTYHSADSRLICHYCGYTQKNPEICPKCKSKYIRYFGTGTQKVEEEIKKQFPGCSVLRMDMDTTTGKHSHEDILKNFREQNINILLGTQMIAKGLDFPNVTLVGVIAADSLLNVGDYRATERTFQLLTQAAGRAGRGDLPGRVIIQTYNTEDFSIVNACTHDYETFYRNEVILRKELLYPPFSNIASITLSGLNDKFVYMKAKEACNTLSENIKQTGSDAMLIGPARTPVTKIKNKFRWRIVLKFKQMEETIKALQEFSDSGYRASKSKTVQMVDMSIDINPVSLM